MTTNEQTTADDEKPAIESGADEQSGLERTILRSEAKHVVEGRVQVTDSPVAGPGGAQLRIDGDDSLFHLVVDLPAADVAALRDRLATVGGELDTEVADD